MYYIKFDCNGNATIYEFEKKMHTVCGTFVPVNHLVSSETGRASELLPKRGIFPVSDETETVNFASVEYNIEGWCGFHGEGFYGTTSITGYKLNGMVPAKKTHKAFTVVHEPIGVYRFIPPISYLVEAARND